MHSMYQYEAYIVTFFDIVQVVFVGYSERTFGHTGLRCMKAFLVLIRLVDHYHHGSVVCADMWQCWWCGVLWCGQGINIWWLKKAT